MEVSGQLHAPAALPPGKKPLAPIRYSLNTNTSYSTDVQLVKLLINRFSKLIITIFWNMRFGFATIKEKAMSNSIPIHELVPFLVKEPGLHSFFTCSPQYKGPATITVFYVKRFPYLPVWWPGNKNSPTVTHACRKRRLKWVATLSVEDINTEVWSSGMGVGRGANNPTL
jgi:hypothetical protein